MQGHSIKPKSFINIKSFINTPKNTSVAPEGWYLSEKFDGYRAILNGKDFISSNGNIFATGNVSGSSSSTGSFL